MKYADEIIKLTRTLLDNFGELDDVLDKALEPSKDYTDTLGDLIAPLKAIRSLVTLKRNLALKTFIKNYAFQLNRNYVIDDREKNKLIDYFKKTKNAKLVADIIDNAVHAKAIKSSAILGVIAGDIIKNKIEMSVDILSVIDTLKEMNDIDLENFVSLMEYLGTLENYNIKGEEFRTLDFYNVTNPNKIYLEQESVELTIEKLKRTNGLTYSAGGLGYVGNAKGAFVINSVSRQLYDLIKNVRVIE